MSKVVQTMILAAISLAAVLAAAPAAGARTPVPPPEEARASQERPVIAGGAGSASQPAAATMNVQLILPPEAPRPRSLAATLRGLRDNTLVQGIILLLLTAAVTGLAVPRIKSGMDLRFFRDQKDHEAELARQASLIADQTKFLRSYARLLWQLHFSMLKISYAKITELDKKEFSALWTKYQTEAWDALQGQRRLISSSVNLVSPTFFARLVTFYQGVRHDEAVLSQMVRDDPDRKQWKEYHDRLLDETAARLDEQVLALASELHLAAEERSQGGDEILTAEIRPAA